MRRILLLLLITVTILTLSGCNKESVSINTSNWKFESLTKDGEKVTASDLDVKETPVFACDRSPALNFFLYCDGAIRHGRVAGNVNNTLLLDFADRDKLCDACISGDKLVIYHEGNKESSLVFRATDEEVLIPVAGERECTLPVEARYLGSGKVEFTNMGTETWRFGEYYKLEVRKDSIWYYVPYTEPYPVHDLAHELAPGQKTELKYDLSFFDMTVPGEYRLATGDLGDGSNICYAYLTADGTDALLSARAERWKAVDEVMHDVLNSDEYIEAKTDEEKSVIVIKALKHLAEHGTDQFPEPLVMKDSWVYIPEHKEVSAKYADGVNFSVEWFDYNAGSTDVSRE